MTVVPTSPTVANDAAADERPANTAEDVREARLPDDHQSSPTATSCRVLVDCSPSGGKARDRMWLATLVGRSLS